MYVCMHACIEKPVINNLHKLLLVLLASYIFSQLLHLFIVLGIQIERKPTYQKNKKKKDRKKT